MSKAVVHDGDTIEGSEGGSVSEPQENFPNVIPNTAMTLAIKVERATDMYVSSRRGMIKSRLICADILINHSGTPEFVALVEDRNPAGEHAATKIISLCSGKDGIGKTRRYVNGCFLEWVRNLSGGDATPENFENPTWVEAMVDHVIAQGGIDECAKKYAEWEHKISGHLGYEPPPAPGSKPKDKGGRPRSKRPIFHSAWPYTSHLFPAPAEFRKCVREWVLSARAPAGWIFLMFSPGARFPGTSKEESFFAKYLVLSRSALTHPALLPQAASGPGGSLFALA